MKVDRENDHEKDGSMVEDTRSLAVADWRSLAEDRNVYRALVESAKIRLGWPNMADQ